MVPIHPLVVHFPIALLIVAAVAYVFSVATRREGFWVLGLFLHMLGVVGAIAAFLSGNSAESSIVHTAEIHDMVELHEMLGMISMWAFGLMAVWSFMRRESKLLWEKALYCLVFCGLAGMLAWNGHLGGRLVYEKGAGVAPMEESLQKQQRLEQSQPQNQPH